MHPDAPKMSSKSHQKSSFCHPNVIQCHPDTTQNKLQCQYCKKIYSTNSNLHKHINNGRCKKKDAFEMIVEQMEVQKKEIQELKECNKNLTNINTQNNGTINYLNFNFKNVQPIQQFLENLKNNFPLSTVDRKCLLMTYNECGIEAFADTFSIIMKKYQSAQVEEGLLPTMPLVLTDGNLRSFKEYHEDGGWKTTQSNSNIDKMIDISNEQIYETERTKVFISQKERKKVHSRMKKDNTLLDMEEIKKKYEDNPKMSYAIKNNIESEDKHIESDEDIESDSEDDSLDQKLALLKENDYSIIDDDYIEKYSKPKVIFDKL